MSTTYIQRVPQWSPPRRVAVILPGPHPSPWCEGMEVYLPEGTLVLEEPTLFMGGSLAWCTDEHAWYLPPSAYEIIGEL